ncbi:hypothetical protein BT67DRAFT_318204 [Trichocladium antarcticum]|uniref:Uncharacterized protein n=1 Tax=Trichocladium antarcticum TaxID=1450529 RepID=A0AAN6UJZ4_9PEZI|nr:hypothetical protein BT67DRAFT_318204 [Trichocladium antarcticum]
MLAARMTIPTASHESPDLPRQAALIPIPSPPAMTAMETSTRELAPACPMDFPGQKNTDHRDCCSSRFASATTAATSSSSTANELCAAQSIGPDPASFDSVDSDSAQSLVRNPDNQEAKLCSPIFASTAVVATSSSSIPNRLPDGQAVGAGPGLLTSPDSGSAQNLVGEPDKLDTAELLPTVQAVGADPASRTSPEIDSAQRPTVEPAENNENNNTKPKPSGRSCALPSRPHKPKKPTKPLAVQIGPSRRRVRYPHRTPNPPLDRSNLPTTTSRTKDGNVRRQQSESFSRPPATPRLHPDNFSNEGEFVGIDTLDPLVDTIPFNKTKDFVKTIRSSDLQNDEEEARKQAQEEVSEPCELLQNKAEERLAALIHEYFLVFPGPDMLEHNRAFDRWFESYRSTFSGFDDQFIETRLGSHAEETIAFARTMENNKQQIVDLEQRVWLWRKETIGLQNEVKEREEELRMRNEDHEAGEIFKREIMIPSCILRKELSDLTRAKHKSIQAFEDAIHRFKDAVVCGAGLALNALRWDFDLVNAIDQRRFREQKNQQAEKEARDLAIDLATMGLRYPLREQDESTAAAIRDTAEPWIKKLRNPAYNPGFEVKLEANLDNLITTIPEWFRIIEAKGTVKLRGAAPMDRFQEFVQLIGRLPSGATKERNMTPQERIRKPFTKHYHEPSRGWPTAKQRVHGGWWTCRSTPDAYAAELGCELCHPRGIKAPDSDKEMGPESEHFEGIQTKTLNSILAEVEKAQVEANKNEQLRVRQRMRKERAQVDHWHWQREWNRQGAGFEAHELLYGRDVNEINYCGQVAASLPTSMPSDEGTGKQKASSILRALPSTPTMLPSPIKFTDFKTKKTPVDLRPPPFPAETWMNETAGPSQPSKPSRPVNIQGETKAKTSALAAPGSKGKAKHVSWKV